MRRFIFLSFLPFTLIFFEGCVPALTLSSPVLQPVQPHVVLRNKNKDTVYARSVIVKDRFLRSKIIADNTVFNKGDILYAHTDSGHRYYVIHNRMIEQVVGGRINVYSNSAEKKQNEQWHINDSGLYAVQISAIGYLQKMPDPAVLKPSYRTIAGLVKDYEPARSQARKAGRMLDNATGAIIAGLTLGLVGAVTAFAGSLDHKNPNAQILQGIGLGSLAVGGLSLGVALPAFRHQARRHSIMAIETYNRGSF